MEFIGNLCKRKKGKEVTLVVDQEKRASLLKFLLIQECCTKLHKHQMRGKVLMRIGCLKISSFLF